ncbi:MAG: hypothetical protein CBB60_007345 [Armatimonadetes bacterium Cent15-Ar3]|nr:MAG: hypothetical protein CBB60_007345 [Armatimonadetes bacterium Cent15-Ar3]
MFPSKWEENIVVDLKFFGMKLTPSSPSSLPVPTVRPGEPQSKLDLIANYVEKKLHHNYVVDEIWVGMGKTRLVKKRKKTEE